MKFTRSLRHVGTLGAAIFLTAGTADAGVRTSSAEGFLTTIYQAYVGDSAQKAKGIALTDPAAIRRYFSPGLASLILDETLSERTAGDALVLGNDPFVGRDRWDITNLTVEVKVTGPAKALGTVSFTNFGRPEKVVVELLKVGPDWRITEINWGPLTLRSIYRMMWQATLEQSPR